MVIANLTVFPYIGNVVHGFAHDLVGGSWDALDKENVQIRPGDLSDKEIAVVGNVTTV